MMAGMLHDLYTYKFMDSKNHAKNGAVFARNEYKKGNSSVERFLNSGLSIERSAARMDARVDNTTNQSYAYNKVGVILKNECFYIRTNK